MNATTRVVAQRNFIFKPLLISWDVSLWHVVTAFVAVLITSFCLLYVKDLNRRLFISYQNLQQTNIQLSTNHAKLLLEESALSAQARIQSLAEQRFAMEVPQNDKIVMVKL